MRARDLAGLLTLATLAGCATSPPEVLHETPAAAPAPLDAPAPVQSQGEREAAPMPAADEELGLAEYERMLAANEERLRAAGVLVAQREPERAVGDARFAQPPPATTPGDALGGASPTGGATASRAKRKDTSKTATAGTARPPAPKPTSTPTKQTKPVEEARPEPKAEAAADADDASRGRCQQICDLADATCDLSGKICDLATRHPGDARYTGLCQRADDDCDLAAAACQRCSP
jgi:hypothetical protein